MSERLASAFAALADRGTVAGAETVWQQAVLAAGVDDQPTDRSATPLVPVLRPGASSPTEWVEVRHVDPFTSRSGRRRVGIGVGLAAAAVIGVGIAAVVAGDRDRGPDGLPGAPGDPSAPTAFVEMATTAPPAGFDTSVPALDESSDTTAAVSPTTFGGAGPGSVFAIGQPCAPDAGHEAPGSTSTSPVSQVPGTIENTATTAVGSVVGYSGPICAYPDGTLPPVTDGPGGDWVSGPTTLPADAALAYWRMLDDLDVAWREESDGTHMYWRSPAGQGGALDGIGGAAVLLIPAADRYIALARAGTTDSGAPGQRPIQVRATLQDGSLAVAPLIYDNDIGLGYAYLDTTMSVMQIAAM